ncbi:uncharacterized protein LOC135169459 [Diachasmimorpha longicaudata]|uniref:uncharacterized protein LOC135169459 n=1 Tax=Diachasmimorpha longicaudata TaxID=58733 RepID=UPI0030B8704B
MKKFGAQRDRNNREKIPFMMGFDGLRGCLISEHFSDFGECEETSPGVIDIIEIKDTACDARFPGQFRSSGATEQKSSVSSFEKLHQGSKIPRLMKPKPGKNPSDRLFPYRGPDSTKKKSESRTEGPSIQRSKLPIREAHSNVLLSRVNSINIDEKCSSPHPQPTSGPTAPEDDSPPEIVSQNIPDATAPPEEAPIDYVRRFTRDSREFERAQETGRKIGQKISRLLEHIKKKQTGLDLGTNSVSAISIMKRALRRDLRTNTIPQAQKNIFPQFYIGSTPREFKLFRCGDEWNSL